MWEWRIFGPREVVPAPAALAEVAGETEERADHYVLLGPDLGFKLRAIESTSPRCELKVRYERHPSGAERWEKVVEKRVPLGGAWLRALLGHLGKDEDPRVAELRTIEDLAALVKEHGLGEPRRVLVTKSIAKGPFAPAYTLECVDLDVGGRLLRSVSIEAPTADLCLEHGTRIGLAKAIAHPEVVLAGYPEALLRLAP